MQKLLQSILNPLTSQIKNGSKTCASLTMNGKTSAMKLDCASGAVGTKITMTFANIGDINLVGLGLVVEGSDAC